MMIVLIPAYKPDQRLVKLVESLNEFGSYKIVVVNDGSGASFDPIFDAVCACGATILTHESNQGKGRALKTGFAYAMQTDCTGVITADADGQHLAKDIDAVGQKLSTCDAHTFVIGSRRFDEHTPLRSRLGNCITRAVFLMASGKRVCDTQTGLRGFPVEMLSWLTKIGGDRYEYEMDVLMAGARADFSVRQVRIDTIYFDENRGSHFSAFRDAFRVYWAISQYCKGSIAASILEYVLFCVFLSVRWIPGAYALQMTVGFLLARIAALMVKYMGFRQMPVHFEPPALLLRTAVSLVLLVGMASLGIPWYFAKLIASLIPLVITLGVYNHLAKKFE